MTSSQQNMQTIFEEMEKQGIKIEPIYKDKIEKRINELRNYVPKVGVFGKTGVGKSSLCNALFGQDVCEVSDVKACTRNPKEVLLSFGGKNSGLKLVDVPGVGESYERDKEYKELYDQLLPELDLIFWVFKSDDRADASNETFYKEVLKRYVNAGKPFLAVINQVDKIEPFREWNEEERRPGAKQAKNIDLKRSHISGLFDLPLTKVIPVSAHEKYGLMELVDAIIHELPNEQKKIVLEKIKQAEEAKARDKDEKKDTIISEKSEVEAEKGWRETIIKTVIEYAGKAIDWIRSWF